MDKSFAESRRELIEEISTAKPGESALQKIAKLRQEYDWAIDGYRNSLSILSDTTYEDRMHFIFELVQNADDAKYSGNAELRFIIKSDYLELTYNEKGFITDDVLSITNIGASTKVKRKNGSNKFIGEKGIGFKSVFALANSVEILSPPWHFKLLKDKCIIPVSLREDNSIKGTSLRLRFNDPEDIAKIADELYRYFNTEPETFLFLQQLTKFTYEDHRAYPNKILEVKIFPENREGDKFTILKLPTNVKKEYVLHTEEYLFTEELSKARWGNAGSDIGAIKRKFIASAMINGQKHGKMFCFLPTAVLIPLPIYLQVDGHTKADRERLHDINSNLWNKHLISILPGFMKNAIMKWRSIPQIARILPEYIPLEVGTDQLAGVLNELKSMLKHAAWVKTSTDSEWECPGNTVIANEFLRYVFKKIPSYRERVEKYLSKQFVTSDWVNIENWLTKLKAYGVKILTHVEVSEILRKVSVGTDFLKNDESFNYLFGYIDEISELKSYKWSWEKDEVINNLRLSEIFPIEGEKFTTLGPKESETKVYWLSTSSKRITGVENSGNIKFRIINPEYTYKAEASSKASDESRDKVSTTNRRNEVVKSVLKKLEVSDLNDDNLLEEIQIPTLLNEDTSVKSKVKLLMAIFDSYRAKRNPDEEYLLVLRKISHAHFESTDGDIRMLFEMALPKDLALYENDKIYYNTSIAVLNLDDEYLRPESIGTGVLKDFLERLEKYRMDLRKFLVECGIKSTPTFIVDKKVYSSYNKFELSDPNKYEAWINKIGMQYVSLGICITVIKNRLDVYTKELLDKNLIDNSRAANIIYDIWCKMFRTSNIETTSDICTGNVPPGYFAVDYSKKSHLVKDISWAGIDSDNISLITYRKETLHPKEVFRIEYFKKHLIPTVLKFLDIVFENEDMSNEGYDRKYLESLNVRKIKISDLNTLWDYLEQEQYPEILRCAIELIDIGLPIDDSLLIYDKISETLRKATEFRLGSGEYINIPMIEQYGAIGHTLGEKLSLFEIADTKTYNKVFDILFYSSNEVKLREQKRQLYSILKNWRRWGHVEKIDIVETFNYALEIQHISAPMILFNERERLEAFSEANTMIVFLEIPEIEIYEMESAAKEIGFCLYNDAGRLSLTGERNLDSFENNVLIKLALTYVESLEIHERSRLNHKMALLGNNVDAWVERVTKARKAYKVIESKGNINIEIGFPYMDNDTGRFIVDAESEPTEILAILLSYFDFTRYKSALAEVNQMKDKIYEESIQSYSGKDDKTTLFNELIRGLEEIKGNLINVRISGSKKDNGKWDLGMTPEEEETFRDFLNGKIEKSKEVLIDIDTNKVFHQKTSEVYEYKKHLDKILNQDYIIPKEFLLHEYDGKCQMCGCQLILSNGKKLIEICRIMEPKKKNLFVDSPFNILGLCPNCYALAKYGGRDFSNIIVSVNLHMNNEFFPMEYDMNGFSGDYYVIKVKFNGETKNLVLTKTHMSYITTHYAFMKDSEIQTVQEMIAATKEK